MAEHNFSAAMKMTMANVVGNYPSLVLNSSAPKAIGSAPPFQTEDRLVAAFRVPRSGASLEDAEDKASPEDLQESSGKIVRR